MTQKSWLRIGIREATRVRKELLEQLHGACALVESDPLDVVNYENRDELADRLWQLSLMHQLTPHVCPDRYCICHVVLFDREPEDLFDFLVAGKHLW